MTERPIPLYRHEVCAVLDGRQTQFRRAMKPQPPKGDYWNAEEHMFMREGSRLGLFRKCPYGVPGSTLWVRETWAHSFECGHYNHLHGNTKIIYRADNGCSPDRWRPSIHMPRWASRLTLEVTDVRVERVQDISEKDVMAEGVYDNIACLCSDEELIDGVRFCGNCGRRLVDLVDGHFVPFWDSINAKRGYPWESNPYVWVVTFKRIEGRHEQ